MVTRSSILAWEIPWTEEPDGLQFMGSQRDGQDLETKQQLCSQDIAGAHSQQCEAGGLVLHVKAPLVTTKEFSCFYNDMCM